ncbi:imidazoleglycerol-phosphate dehydratase HisB [candidate division KSB1 bacterium]|nr:imidazoleglycerol-phosphate dehydratase HisB [candidate division KSB1 bacterium]
MARTATINRETKETRITMSLNLDGTGQSEISTGIGFFDHMLESFSKHGQFDLTVKAKGDLHVDDHHTVEDVGLCLGQAIAKTVGDKRGISRFGSALCPMDESLARAVLDLSGRPYCVCEIPINPHKLGEMHGTTMPEFFRAVSTEAGMTLHLDVLRGQNLHHAIEALFKAFARALNQAVSPFGNSDDLPSTKGTL